VTVWRFGTFELDDAAGELRKAGRRIQLVGQPLRALQLLVSRAGEVVSRQELQHHIWGESTFVQLPSSLAFCIGRVRLALGDSARSPRFLETIPRRGYRFLCPVERVEAWERPPARRHPGGRGAAVRAALVGIVLATTTGVPIRAHTRDSATPAALAAFQRGQRLSGGSVVERRSSVYAYREAIRRDPRFAEAHWALAEVYLGLAERGELPFRAALEEAHRHAESALALEDIPDTHLVLAATRWFLDWDWKGARREYEAAVREAPDSDAVLVDYARYLSATGSDAEAIRVIDRAEAMTPGCDLVVHESGMIRFRARLYDAAIRKFERAATLGPPEGQTGEAWQRLNRFLVFRVHARQRAWVEAQADAVEIVRLSQGTAEGARRLGALAPREAVERFLAGCVDYMTTLARSQYVAHTDVARALALAGRTERAIDLLETAAEAREPPLVYSVRDPDFDGIRGTARFAALLTKLGLGSHRVSQRERGVTGTSIAAVTE
jgi:DNA-binding winged helix-turn-helix (wHTH) protein/tetratricopeptide (TPR) repeat protein